MRAPAPIAVGSRLRHFAYAIRNVIVEAKKVEESGRPVTYLNIGDPVAFGFRTPPHLVDAVERAMRDGANGYTPAAGIWKIREAVAAGDPGAAKNAMAAHFECLRRGLEDNDR